MVNRLLNMIVIVLVVAPVPGWLYASGNLPAFAPQNRIVMGAFYSSYPQFFDATYVASRCVYETMRNFGLRVPLTFNERVVQIKNIRQSTIEICDEILHDN